MPGPYKEAGRRLREIAQSQQGFFTTKQARRFRAVQTFGQAPV